jgi:hypothetical protein
MPWQHQQLSHDYENIGPTLYGFEVGAQGLLKYWMPEQAALWDITHEQFDNHKQLVDCLVKTGSCLRLWRSSDSLL